MTTTVRELAALVGGLVQGDADQEILAARPLREAGAGDITFIEHERYVPDLNSTEAAAAVVGLKLEVPGKTVIRVADPLFAFIAIVQHFQGNLPDSTQGIDPRASLHDSVELGANPSIHAFASIGAGSRIGARCQIHSGVSIGRDCVIGDDVCLHPNVVLYDRTVLGDRVTIHANSVIGADGFGYRMQNGQHVKIPQLGNVVIGDDVEIGSCTTVDRSTFGSTRIGSGTKIDNLVMIAHNCQVGRHNILVSQVGMAGSSGTGDYVVIAGQVGVVDHVYIGAGSMIGGQAAVTKDVPPGQRMLGSPATDEREQKRMLMSLTTLPELRKRMRVIEQQLGIRGETREAG